MKTKHLLMNEAVDDTKGGTGGSGYVEETPETTEKTETTGDTSENTTKTEGTGDTKTSGEDDKSKQSETSKEQKDATGYGDESKDADKNKDQTTKTDEIKLDYEIDFKGLKEDQTKDLIEFAKANKLTKEQAQAIMDKRKEVIDIMAQQQADHEKEKVETYSKWTKELKDHPEFGGANYNSSVHTVNKFLREHLPTTAKYLTETGKRLSPKEMIELRAVAMKLSDEGSHEQGGTTKSNNKERNPWDYYNN